MHQSCLPHQGSATRGVKPRTSLTQTTFAFFSWKMGRSCAQALFDAFAESSYVILHNTNYASMSERVRRHHLTIQTPALRILGLPLLRSRPNTGERTSFKC